MTLERNISAQMTRETAHNGCFSLVCFYGISTIQGYLMPNLFYPYISSIYDFSTHFVDNIFPVSELIFYTELNGFTYFYLIWRILFTINYLFAQS